METDGLPGTPDKLYEGYVFDLDGTIYFGDELLLGAKRLIPTLRELGKRVVFLSNNPTRDPQMYADKLTGLGLPHRRGAAEALIAGGRHKDVGKSGGDRLRHRQLRPNVRVSEAPDRLR